MPVEPGEEALRPARAAAPIERIAVFALDGLVAGIVVRELLDAFPGKIALVCFSDRYHRRGRNGFPLRQFREHLVRSGVSFVVLLILHYFVYHLLAYAADAVNRALGRKRKLVPLPRLCRERGVPVHRTRDINGAQSLAAVAAARPDLIVLAGFDQILRKRVLAIPARGVLNIHPSQLPHFRGPMPVYYSLLNGTRPGVTVYAVTAEIDGGPILRQAIVERGARESVLGLECRLMRDGARMAIEAIRDLDAGRAAARAQAPGGSTQSFPTQRELGLLRRRGVKLFTLAEYLGLFLGT